LDLPKRWQEVKFPATSVTGSMEVAHWGFSALLLTKSWVQGVINLPPFLRSKENKYGEQECSIYFM
jgi:hypothetical protein